MRDKFSALLVSFFVFFCPVSLKAQTPFERMDTDGDDKLSRYEFRGPPRAFNRLDRNHDGHLVREEVSGTLLLRTRRQAGEADGRRPGREAKELVYIDTHYHLVGPKKQGQLRLEKSVRNALTAMDVSGVKQTLLVPMPQVAGQSLQLRLEDLLPIVERYPKRFAALGGGGTLNGMIQQAVKQGRVTADLERKFETRALEIIQKGAVGFGEMTAEHFSMSEHHPYETAPPDHPLFLRLADLAAKYDLPIDIHMEAIPEEMPMPPRFKSPPNPKVLKPNIAAFSRLLAHNRRARIIWVHLGWDNTRRRTVALTRRLLAENSNLYMSIRIASGMQTRKVEAAGFPLDKNGRLQQEWLEMFKEFPDRFVLGSDEIVKASNDHPSAGSLRSTTSILDQLPTQVRQRIGYKNASLLYKSAKF